MSATHRFLPLLIAFSHATIGAKAATTNDLKADWSDTQNPNGVWAYNQGTNPLPRMDCIFAGCGVLFTCCLSAWARASACGSNPGISPAWWKVPPCDFTNYYDLRAGDIAMHSRDDANGAGNGEGNVTWTASGSGFVTISGAAWHAANLGRGNHWSLFQNGTLLTGGDIIDGDSYTRATPFDFGAGSGGPDALKNVTVSPGDVIKLQITRTSTYGTLAGANLTVAFSTEPIGGPALRIQLNPGILVYGTIGKTYRIDYVAQAGNTNWMTLTTVTNLPSSPYLVFDAQPATLPARLYRAVEIP